MKQVNLSDSGGAFVRAAGNTAANISADGREAQPQAPLVAEQLDLPAILERARQARAVHAGRLVVRAIASLRRALRRALRSDVERYLTGASDLADVERRLRVLERGGMPHAY